MFASLDQIEDRHFRAIHALVGIRVNLRSAPLAQSSKHPNIFTSFASPTLECSDVRLGWQETRKRVLELRRPVTVPREICSLGRMNDDRTDLEVFQQAGRERRYSAMIRMILRTTLRVVRADWHVTIKETCSDLFSSLRIICAR